MAKSTAPQMTHKNLSAEGVKVLSEEEGIVEAFVAGIGNKDSVGDIIQPGAFSESIEAMKPKGVWSHDWDRPVSKTLEIYEVDAGDSRLPEKMKAAGIGGLYVKTQFNLDTQDGRDAFSWVKFYDDESEWSIGYQTLDEEYDKKKKANLLNKVKLYEYSPVLFGANPLTSTVGLKVDVVSNGEENQVKIEIEGLPEGEQKSALIAAIEAAAKAELDTKGEDPEDESEKDDAVDGAEAETTEVDEEAEKTAEESGADSQDSEKADEAEAQEKGPEGLEDEKSEGSEDEDDDDEAGDPEPEASDDDDDDDDSDDDSDDEAADEEKGLSPIVESFMTYAEKAEFSDTEAKALQDFISERVEEKAVEGSVEQRLGNLAKALYNEFEDAGTYVYLYATFDSTVIFYKGGMDGGGFYEASYSITDEGVEFGEEKAVDVVEVVVAKHAVMNAAFKGHAEGVKSLLAPLVEASVDAEGDSEIKQAIIDGIEAKAGAKLSKANKGLIESAIDSLEKVLGAAEDDDAEEKSEEPETDEKSEEGATDEVTDEESVEDEKSENADETKDSEPEPLVVPEDELAELQALAQQYLNDDDD
jgi:HK97 family phage prohead protease